MRPEMNGGGKTMSDHADYWKRQAVAQRDAYLETLRPFLAINSIEDMSTAGPGKPFGDGVARALDFMLALGRSDGFAVKNLDGYAGYVEYGESDEEVGVLVHVDVVTAGDGWTTPPFEPHIRDGKIYARGAIDDKGPALAAYFALRLLKQSGLPLAKRVRLIIGTDEESGWLCMKHYAERETLPEIGFSPDASFPMIHAEKGQINPTLTLAAQPETAAAAGWRLLSFVSGDQGNSVPDKAAASVAVPAGAEAETAVAAVTKRWDAFLHASRVTGRLEQRAPGVLSFQLDGKPAHGMEPFNGVNAGTLLARFLHDTPFAGSDREFLRFLAEILHEDHYGERLNVACRDDVSGALTVNAGILRYDGSAGGSVRLNIRYPATLQPEPYAERLKARVEELGWTVSDLRTSKSHHVPADHPVIRTLSRVYEQHTGEPARLLASGGATYAKTLKAGVAFGPVFPGKESTAHLADEYAEIDDLLRAMAIYAQAMYELAK
jgi:succinyl-diaminopimelate desuccinylase